MAVMYHTRYADAPLMIYWEVTRSCDLACRHCRAEAVPWRNPNELTTDEGYRLIDALSQFGRPAPNLVFTGGDPLKRPDIYDLAAHAVQAGLGVAITPSGTPLLTEAAIDRLMASGVRTMALSIDGSTAERHDHIRQVAGSFTRTVTAARWMRERGINLQINSLVARETVGDLADLYHLAVELDADRWSVFFLVNVGRGAVLQQIDPFMCEAVLEWLYDLARTTTRPVIKTTEAPHYRRISLQKEREAGPPRLGPAGPGERAPRSAPPTGHPYAALGGDALPPGTPIHSALPAGHPHAAFGGPAHGAASARRAFGIRDGAGIMFISHTGEVYPSGFLPIGVGNVKRQDPVALYRTAPLFVQLRDPSAIQGKCGACQYRSVCGGSRARAWAATGDPLAADPLCVYRPPAGAVDVLDMAKPGPAAYV